MLIGNGIHSRTALKASKDRQERKERTASSFRILVILRSRGIEKRRSGAGDFYENKDTAAGQTQNKEGKSELSPMYNMQEEHGLIRYRGKW